jgi:hypothetical protein
MINLNFHSCSNLGCCMASHLLCFYIIVTDAYLMCCLLVENYYFENFEHCYYSQNLPFISFHFCVIVDLFLFKISNFAVKPNLIMKIIFVKYYYFKLSKFDLMLTKKKILTVHSN